MSICTERLTNAVDEMSRRLDNLEAKLKDAEDKKSGPS